MTTSHSRHGFRLIEQVELPELGGVGRRWVHERTGARLLHLDVGDDEHLFCAAFRTPPPDDTGLPHILEHTVLCGSRKYPVKDPFVELLKSSLATFLNAITWPDRTIYPCASTNARDFMNLISVYCDAVFHPLLKKEHFQQEGYHYALREPCNLDSELTIVGIVFNEMKGAYSTLDGLIERTTESGLFPDTAAGRDSGGWPEAIPSLTYERFVEFHRAHYHPSNAYFFLYTSWDPSPYLEFLDREVLRAFERGSEPPPIPLQPKWSEPRRVVVPYPAMPDETPDRRTAHAMAWVVNPVEDLDSTLALSVAHQYLLGHAGSPLRRALLESGLGEEIIESYSSAHRECTWTIGLYGTNLARTAEIEQLVFGVLARECQQGFDRDELDSAFHQFELAALDVPELFPLRLMDRVYMAWVNGADPWAWLNIRERLREWRQRLQREPQCFEEAVRRWILHNPHRLHMTFVPDADYERRQEEAWAQRLSHYKASLSRAELEALDREARELERKQAEPNPPDALATLPRLARKDIPPDPRPLEVDTAEVDGCPWMRVAVLTRGVVYVHLALDLSDLELGWWPWLPSLLAVWLRSGAAGEDYAAMARREAAVCGGVGGQIQLDSRIEDPRQCRPSLGFFTHALEERVEAALGVVRDRVLQPDFWDLDRIRTILLERYSSLRDDVVASGSTYAATRATRRVSGVGQLAEWTSGIEQVRWARKLAEEVRVNPDLIAHTLAALHRRVLSRPRWVMSVAGPNAACQRTREWFRNLIAATRAHQASEPAPEPPTVCDARLEGIALPSEVGFLGLAVPSAPAASPHAAPLHVLMHHLSLEYLWQEIRVKRGAYGCRSGYDPTLGVLTFSSYRDPSTDETLAVMTRIPDIVQKELDLSPDTVDRAVVGALKGMDRPWRPASAVAMAVRRHFSGVTEEFRRQLRRRILAVSPDDLREVAATWLQPLRDPPAVCIIGGREYLDAHAPTGTEIHEL